MAILAVLSLSMQPSMITEILLERRAAILVEA